MARGAVAGNKDDGTEHTLETGDKITLGFGGNSVIVQERIYLTHIIWVTTNGSSKFAVSTTTPLANTADSATSVVLTALSDCADIDSDETVAFNIVSTIPIVDSAGGNRVLPAAAATTFTDGIDF